MQELARLAFGDDPELNASRHRGGAVVHVTHVPGSASLAAAQRHTLPVLHFEAIDRSRRVDGGQHRLGRRPLQSRRTQAHEYVCTTWFEQDRAHIALTTPRGRLVFELWDDGVFDAIDSGYLKPPRVPRPRDRDWQPAAVQYAIIWG
ncbi:MAG: hypothetical protein QM740_20060 [Acidovorax sp.]